jgi:hypothetical protein
MVIRGARIEPSASGYPPGPPRTLIEWLPNKAHVPKCGRLRFATRPWGKQTGTQESQPCARLTGNRRGMPMPPVSMLRALLVVVLATSCAPATRQAPTGLDPAYEAHRWECARTLLAEQGYQPSWGQIDGCALARQQMAARGLDPSAGTTPDGWRIVCNPRRASASVTCATVRLRQGWMLHVAFTKERSGRVVGPMLSMSPAHDCPGYDRVVRVDGNVPVRIHRNLDHDVNPAGEARIVQQMRSGSILYTENYEWPYCTRREAAHDLAGFGEAYNRLRQAVTEARPE